MHWLAKEELVCLHLSCACIVSVFKNILMIRSRLVNQGCRRRPLEEQCSRKSAGGVQNQKRRGALWEKQSRTNNRECRVNNAGAVQGERCRNSAESRMQEQCRRNDVGRMQSQESRRRVGKECRVECVWSSV